MFCFLKCPLSSFSFMLYLGYPLGIKGEKKWNYFAGWMKIFISHFIIAQLLLYGQIHSMNEASSIWYVSLLIVIWDYVSSMFVLYYYFNKLIFLPSYSLIFPSSFLFHPAFLFRPHTFPFPFHPSFLIFSFPWPMTTLSYSWVSFVFPFHLWSRSVFNNQLELSKHTI